MSFQTRSRVVNPRLGTYFSIFASLFTAIFVLALIFEQLSVGDGLLRAALFIGPIILYFAIGAAVAAREPLDFFAAGRRVPAGYTGLLLAVGAAGGTFIVCGTGMFFISGFDALILLIGGLSGFVFMATLLAPFYRKFGAYTVPSYFGRRFDSKALRIAAAMVTAVPILLVLSAELHVGSVVAARLTGYDAGLMVVVLAAAVAATLSPGGARGLTWSGVAQAVAVLIALAAVSATVATLVTSLPVPQLTHGPLVRNLVRNEAKEGLQIVLMAPWGMDLPGEGLQTITKPYTQPFGSIGTAAFTLAALTIATGIAAAPWLLPRVAATPSVYEARKSLGWATVLFGILMLTLSSAAVFLRHDIFEVVAGGGARALPEWFADLKALSLARAEKTGDVYDYSSLAFERDGVLFALPVATGMARAYVYLAMAGALAAALLSSGATAAALATVLSEDVVQGLQWEPASAPSRVWIARVFISVAAASGAVLTLLAPTDPLRLVLWALSLSSASLFPILVLSIWWKRLTRGGAITGLLGGFGVAALSIFMGEAGAIGLPSAIAGILGLPVATAIAMIVSSLVPETSRHDLEVVRDIRVPGGEIIYDREMRRLQIQKQARS